MSQEKQINIQNQIRFHQNEITRLSSSLKVPRHLAGTMAGGFLGYALGSSLGSMGRLALAGTMGALGRRIGSDNELTEDQKNKILRLIDDHKIKIQQLKALAQGQKGTISGADIKRLVYDTYNFSAPWAEFIGHPSKNFHAMIFGRPKSGKSILAMRFADYLTKHGKVLYIASEEGFGKTLQDKVRQWTRGKGIDFSDVRDYAGILAKAKGYDFIVIDSVNFAKITHEEVEQLKNTYPTAAFITIHQTTKQGTFRGGQEYAHNCDVVISVEEGLAESRGRFSPGGVIEVFPKKKVKS